jgi:branched-chain amino acid transport system permease protein
MTAAPATLALRRRVRGVTSNEVLRRFIACVLGGLVLALMTGPSGSAEQPTAGFSGSLLSAHVFPSLGLGLGLFVIITLRRGYDTKIRAVSERVSALPRLVMPNRQARYGFYLLLLAAAIVVPLHISGYWQEVLVDQIGIYVLLAMGLNVVVGYAGLLDLGYIAFYAIGAYATAFWTGALPIHPVHINAFYAIPLAILTAMLAGVLLGAPTLRLRGDYLAIVTLGFGEIIQIVATNLTGITAGAAGVLGIPHFAVHLLGVHYVWGVSSLPYYYLLLAFIVIAIVAFHSLEESRVGRAWSAIREDEVAAEASGVHVLKYKVMAFAIGASTSGFAGALTASKISYITPGSFTVQLSILVLVLVIFGGMGSLPGAIAGAAVLQWLPQLLRVHPLFGFQPPDLYIYLGALLVAMMIFRPQGILPSKRRRREILFAEIGVDKADSLAPMDEIGSEGPSR